MNLKVSDETKEIWIGSGSVTAEDLASALLQCPGYIVHGPLSGYVSARPDEAVFAMPIDVVAVINLN